MSIVIMGVICISLIILHALFILIPELRSLDVGDKSLAQTVNDLTSIVSIIMMCLTIHYLSKGYNYIPCYIEHNQPTKSKDVDLHFV